MRVIFILFLSFFFGCSSDTPVNMDEVLFERGERFISMKNQKVYNGPRFKMYKNGQKQEQGSIENGWRSDTWTGWYEDGKKKFVGDYVEGKPHGSWNGFYRNGQKKYEGEYKNGKKDLNAARLRMARIPEGAKLIKNKISGAPGFIIKNVFVMAGVPQIFEAMVQEISLDLEPIEPILSKTIKIFKKESEISERLWQYADRYKDISIGSYPFNNSGVFGVEIVLSHTDITLLNKIFNEILLDFNEPNTN